MDKAERRQESEQLRAALMQVRDKLDDLIGHLEEDVLPPRMIAASAHHLMSAAMTSMMLETPRHAHRGPA
jgi:hypothetical protein